MKVIDYVGIAIFRILIKVSETLRVDDPDERIHAELEIVYKERLLLVFHFYLTSTMMLVTLWLSNAITCSLLVLTVAPIVWTVILFLGYSLHALGTWGKLKDDRERQL